MPLLDRHTLQSIYGIDTTTRAAESAIRHWEKFSQQINQNARISYQIMQLVAEYESTATKSIFNGCCPPLANPSDEYERIEYLHILISQIQAFMPEGAQVELELDARRAVDVVLNHEFSSRFETVRNCARTLGRDKCFTTSGLLPLLAGIVIFATLVSIDKFENTTLSSISCALLVVFALLFLMGLKEKFCDQPKLMSEYRSNALGSLPKNITNFFHAEGAPRFPGEGIRLGDAGQAQASDPTTPLLQDAKEGEHKVPIASPCPP